MNAATVPRSRADVEADFATILAGVKSADPVHIENAAHLAALRVPSEYIDARTVIRRIMDAAPETIGDERAAIKKAAKRGYRKGDFRRQVTPLEPVSKLAEALEYEERKAYKRRERQINRELVDEEAVFVEIPAFETIDALSASDPSAFVIDGLLPIDGNALLAAQAKAGKTHLAHNLIRSLVDGDAFLDEFAVLARRRVTLLDFELSRRSLGSWLDGQGIGNRDALTVVSLRGKAVSFDVLRDDVRSDWATRLRDAGTETLIIDPLRPILAALRLNEWNETGPLLQAFDALKEEAGIRELIVAQHYGHHAQRAAGDSRLLGWPDAIWNLTLEDGNDPRSFRFFDAYGRDIDQPRGLVSLYDERRLAFAHDALATKKERAVDRLIEWLAEHPEAKRAEIIEARLGGITEKTFVRVIENAGDRVAVTTGEKNAKHYSVAERIGLLPLDPAPTPITDKEK